MRLISCHIENFGKLSDETISFGEPDGINVICENNGWGKSTLAAFIKVMFFGFDNEGKRNNIENERQRFKPWQGGVYGGQLTFEADDRTYIMSRTFGIKEKDDEFILQDADTRLASTNFSKNIGEELFQIDSASFVRSIYISQNDCVTATTDSINAKLGNLTDNTDDLNNYETAAKKIADRLNSLSKTRKTGELYKQKEQIAELRQEIKKAETLDASMEELLRLKNELHDSYEALKDEQRQLQGKQKSVSEYKDVLVKKKEYELLCEEASKKQSRYEEKKAFFPVRIPEGDEADKYIALEYQTSVLKKNMDSNKPNDEEINELALLSDKFRDGLPAKEMVDGISSKVSEMQGLRSKIEQCRFTEDEKADLERLRVKFADTMPAVQEIDELSNAWTRRSEKKNMLTSKISTLEMLKLTNGVNEQGSDRTQDAGRKKPNMAPVVIFAVAALLGLLFCFILPLAGIGILAADIAAVIILAVRAKASSAGAKSSAATGSSRTEDSSSTNTQHSSANGNAVPPYFRLQQEIADDEALISKTEADMKQFFAGYGLPYDENSVMSELYRLKEDVILYTRLLKKSENSEEDSLKQRYIGLRNEVDGFLNRYGIQMGETGLDMDMDIAVSYVNLIHKLEISAGRYTALKSKQESYEKSYEEYKNNMDVLKAFIDELKIKADMKSETNLSLNTNLSADTNLSSGTATALNSLLLFIKDEREDYVKAELEYKKAVEAKNKYEEENNKILDLINNTEMDEEDASLADIEQRLGEITVEIEKYHSSMTAYDRQLDELQEKRDDITDFENRLEELQESYEQNDKRLTTLQKTQKYLEQAKISLTAKYTQPIKDGFDKYFGILCGIESENYQLDANFDLSVVEQGMPRDTAFLSAGYQDMVGICMRMALIDAMYQDEKPFVIFDDPFVNLDAEKTKGGLRLLDVIAEEYQVVYFTCNESRR